MSDDPGTTGPSAAGTNPDDMAAEHGVRRVVTGHTADGRPTVASDSVVSGFRPDLSPGLVSYWLWKAAAPPVLPDDGAVTTDELPFFPGVGGYGFAVIEMRPTRPGKPLHGAVLDRARAQYEAARPGALVHNDQSAPGMHTTDTVDMCVLVSGELTLELDEGATTVLRAGDVLVQNGTRHRWHNRTDDPAVLAVFFTGAHRRR